MWKPQEQNTVYMFMKKNNFWIWFEDAFCCLIRCPKESFFRSPENLIKTFCPMGASCWITSFQMA
jgi:hypothetical protein